MLKIGSIELEFPVFQSALSGYSDYAMRKISSDFGCPMTFAGVMLAKSVNNAKVIRRQEFRPRPGEVNVGGQVLGRCAETMSQACAAMVGAGYDVVDLNMACPAPKVLRRGRGGALLKEPEVAIEIIKRARDAVEVPLFLKLRTGWGRGAESVERFWQIVEAAAEIGVDVVVVHGRSVTERFRGKAEWQTVGDVKKKFNSLIVLGSGDVFDVSSLDKMRESGIDGLVVARGAVGNPWVFGQLRAAFAGEPLPAEPSLKEQAAVMREHFELVQELYKSRKSVGYFRKFAMYYCKRHPERKKVQLELMAAKTSDQFISAMKKWYGDC